jgi:TPR repeat protein
MLHFGEGAPIDFEQAGIQYGFAATHDNGDALNNLGGFIEEKDAKGGLERAAACHEKAANLGHPCGQYNWARFLEMGRGIPRDLINSQRFYQMAADAGHQEARANLDRLKGNGTFESASLKVQRGLLDYESGLIWQAADKFRSAGSPSGIFNLAF